MSCGLSKEKTGGWEPERIPAKGLANGRELVQDRAVGVAETGHWRSRRTF